MNNILFSVRMLKRNKLLLFIGIPGLAIGLAVVLLLVSYLRREFSFDKHFSTKDRVVRLYNTVTKGDNDTYGICLRDAYHNIPTQVAEVEAATQIFKGWKSQLTNTESLQSFENLYKLYVDNDFFRVFDQKLLIGNNTNALQGKYKIVLTRSTAQKLFATINCVGKQMQMDDYDKAYFTVAGVVEDLPDNSHIKYDFLVSMETISPDDFGGLEFYTYFLLKDNADVATASKNIEQANNILMQPWMEAVGLQTTSETVLLKNIHFFTKSNDNIVPSANLTYMWLVGVIISLVLLIALVNFTNLYSLHSSMRIGEIAMRKSLGASYMELARLFFSDTLVITLVALSVALGLGYFASPYFSHLLNTKVAFNELFTTRGLLILVGVLGLIVFLSSVYPLFSLSKVNLSLGVQGKTNQVKHKSYTTKTALLFQFSIAAFLIAGVVIFYAQVRYMKAIPLGFNPNNVEAFIATSSTLSQKMPSIKEEIEKLPFVEQVATSYHNMGGGYSGQAIGKYGSVEKPILINEYRVQPGFAKTMQMELIDGSFFSTDNAKHEIILNEAAIKKLGLSMPAVGQKVEYNGEKIIKGVVKNFYYWGNAGEHIQPLVLAAYSDRADVLYTRTAIPITQEQKAQIVGVFRQFDDTYIYQGHSLKELYDSKFSQENMMMEMVATGALLAILLSISGLVALSLLNVSRRTKEIGIRKIMGSTERQILNLLIKQILIWVLISCAIGFVVNYYVMQNVLQNFVNRIDISPIYFLISTVVVLFITILAVGWQSWRAANRNPVEALRYE